MTDHSPDQAFRWSDPSAHPLAPQLVAAVREAGALALAAFGKPMKTWLKDKSSPVSEADIAVDAFLESRLAALAPDAGWLSEETEDAPGKARGGAGLDRRSDRRNTGLYRRHAGLDYIGGPGRGTAGRLLAALYAPVSEEFFFAVAGRGATCNGMPIAATVRGIASPGARVGGPKSYPRTSCRGRAAAAIFRRAARAFAGAPPRPRRRWHASMPLSPAATAMTGTLPLPIFWCTKPAAR